MYFFLYKDTVGQWRWRLISSGNHKTVADSAENYWNKQDALHGVNLVKSAYKVS